MLELKKEFLFLEGTVCYATLATGASSTATRILKGVNLLKYGTDDISALPASEVLGGVAIISVQLYRVLSPLVREWLDLPLTKRNFSGYCELETLLRDKGQYRSGADFPLRAAGITPFFCCP